MITESKVRISENARSSDLPVEEHKLVAATFLTVRERSQVSASLVGHRIALRHRHTLDDLASDLAQVNADTVLLSTALVHSSSVPYVATLVRAFPEISFAGLVLESREA